MNIIKTKNYISIYLHIYLRLKIGRYQTIKLFVVTIRCYALNSKGQGRSTNKNKWLIRKCKILK